MQRRGSTSRSPAIITKSAPVPARRLPSSSLRRRPLLGPPSSSAVLARISEDAPLEITTSPAQNCADEDVPPSVVNQQLPLTTAQNFTVSDRLNFRAHDPPATSVPERTHRASASFSMLVRGSLSIVGPFLLNRMAETPASRPDLLAHGILGFQSSYFASASKLGEHLWAGDEAHAPWICALMTLRTIRSPSPPGLPFSNDRARNPNDPALNVQRFWRKSVSSKPHFGREL